MLRCLDCGILVSWGAKRCNKCNGKAKRVRPPVKACIGCGKQLSPWAHKAGTKRCRKCAAGTPEERARRSTATRQLYVDRPELREHRRRGALELNAREDKRARQDAARGRWRQGVRQSRLAWCPQEYWDTYGRLRDRQMPDPATGRWSIDGRRLRGSRMGAAKARQMIERHLGGPLREVSMTWPQYCRRECTLGGRVVKLAPGKIRFLSIMLLADPAVYLTTTDLIERAWPDPDFEPDSAARIVHQYILRLRRAGVRIVRARAQGRGWRIPAEARAGGRTADLATAARLGIIPLPPPRGESRV